LFSIEEESVVREKDTTIIPTRRGVFSSVQTMEAPPSPSSTNHRQGQGQRCGPSARVAQCPSRSNGMAVRVFLFTCAVATSHRIHIFSLHTTNASQHLQIASPQIFDLDIISYHPQATGDHKRLATNDNDVWAKSGTLRTMSEYRRVHDQTTCSNGRNQRRQAVCFTL